MRSGAIVPPPTARTAGSASTASRWIGPPGRAVGGGIVCLLALVMGAGRAEAKVKEKSIQQLPRDAWELAFVWTEPIKYALKESRRFDPVSGLWFGIVEGSVKSVERTAGFFLPGDKDREGSEVDSGKVLIRYTF